MPTYEYICDACGHTFDEFQSITGVVEDATDIILNLKQVPFKLNGDGPKAIYLKAEHPGVEVDVRLRVAGDRADVVDAFESHP